MKKTSLNKIATGSKIAIAATFLSVPLMTMPLSAQKAIRQSSAAEISLSPESSSSKLHYTIKMSSATVARIVGVESGKTIYQNDKNEYFYLDPKSGDMKYLSSDYLMKMPSNRASGSSIFIKVEMPDRERKVTILGIDDKGNVIQENSKKEKFYLDQKTGDMVFVK